MNKRELSSIQTKEKLLKATKELLKTKGFSTINVSDITKQAGVAKGSFYTYFKRKEDIILEIGKDAFSKIMQDVAKMENIDIIQKLTFYYHAFMKAVEYYGIYVCSEWIRDVLDNKNGQKLAYDIQMLTEFLKQAVQKKELKKDTPVELLVQIIITQLYGMMTCWCMSDGKFEPLEWSEKFCKIQLETIIKQYKI